MTQTELQELHRRAQMDGLLMSVWRSVCFYMYLYGFLSPMLSMASTLSTLMIPFLTGSRLRRYRDSLPGKMISFRRGVAFYVMVFFYASIVFALVQYVYFAFLDNGYLAEHYCQLMQTDQMKEMLKANGIPKKMVNEMMDEMRNIKPSNFVLSVAWMNLMLGVMASVPFALIHRRTRPKQEEETKNER